MMKLTTLILLILFSNYQVRTQTIHYQTFTSSSDNTIYEDSVGQLSNGQGQDLRCGTDQTGKLRRSVVKFKIRGIPQNATVVSAWLKLEIAQSSIPAGSLTCHRARSDWGEGLSNAGIKSDSGTTPMVNDATWIHKFYPNQLWNNPGGDYETVYSDSVTTGIAPFALFQSPGLINDVQLFLDSNHLNFGWFILGVENVNNSILPFYSTQFQPGLQPALNIGYITTTNIDKIEPTEEITIFPNPTSEYLRLEGVKFLKKEPEFIIKSIQGKAIKIGNITSNKIDVSMLKDETYFISIYSEDVLNKTMKFVKQ